MFDKNFQQEHVKSVIIKNLIYILCLLLLNSLLQSCLSCGILKV